MLLGDSPDQTLPLLVYLFSSGLRLSGLCCLESQWVRSWRREQNCGYGLEGSLASCWGWRSEETGWLVLNDLSWLEGMETMESLQRENRVKSPDGQLKG